MDTVQLVLRLDRISSAAKAWKLYIQESTPIDSIKLVSVTHYMLYSSPGKQPIGVYTVYIMFSLNISLHVAFICYKKLLRHNLYLMRPDAYCTIHYNS